MYLSLIVLGKITGIVVGGSLHGEMVKSRAAARKPCLRHLSRVQHNKTQHFDQIEFPLNDVLTYMVMSLM